MKEPISILHHMARSGGTLISKCLGCMEDVALLSEVHPRAAAPQFNPLSQAHAWLDIDVPAAMKAAKLPESLLWADAIQLIYNEVRRQNRRLLVRDWTHLDFTGVPWMQPTYELSTAKVLGERYAVNQVFTVRHPIDQWLSLNKLSVIEGKLTVPQFLEGYKAFAEKASGGTFIRYEDFTADPQAACRTMCDALGLNYDASFISKWSSFAKLTGDTPNTGAGRASRETRIKPLKRRPVEADLLRQFTDYHVYWESLELLGYESSKPT